MAKALASKAEQDHFLADPRLGILIQSRADRSPIGIPVWFEWDGVEVKMFSGKNSPKVARLKNNPSASFLVTNRVGEKEAWLAFDGDIKIDESVSFSFIEQLAERYWDMSDPIRIEELKGWKALQSSFCALTLVPKKIRTGN